MLCDPQSFYIVDKDFSIESEEMQEKTYEKNINLVNQVWLKVDEAEREIQDHFKLACTQMGKYVEELTNEIEKNYEIQNKTLEQMVAKIRVDNERMKLKKV